MKFKLTAFLFVVSIATVFAQEKKWTLQECVEYAVENNLTIAQSELALKSSIIDLSDARGAFLPDLNGSSAVSGNSGLSFNAASQDPVTTSVSNVSLSLTSSVTLFDGLQNYNRIQRAKLNGIANQYSLDDIKDDIRLSVANSYLQVLSSKESLKVARAQFEVTEQDLKRTKELVDSGVLPKGDLLEIEATAANQEQQIVNGESLALISKINLAQLLQIVDYENFEIAEESFEVPPSDILNNTAKTIFEKALEFRNDIKFSSTNVALSEKDLDIAKGAIYPTLNGFFNYNTRWSDANNFFGGFTDQLYKFDGISYGVQLSVPVFNGFSTRNNISRAKINVDISKLQLAQDKLVLETTINQAYVDVTSFFKAYEAAEKTLEARRLAYQYSKERFDVGLMNSFDFSQAQSRVDNAEADVVRTKYDYIFRLKILEFYFGIPMSLN